MPSDRSTPDIDFYNANVIVSLLYLFIQTNGLPFKKSRIHQTKSAIKWRFSRAELLNVRVTALRGRVGTAK